MQATDSFRTGSALPGTDDAAFRTLLENLPAAAYTCDADGHLTAYNQRAVELWGREPRLHDPAERFCGAHRLFDAASGRALPHDQCWMAQALRREEGFNAMEIIVERPDGTRVHALAHANPIKDAGGRVTGAVNVLTDITERRQAEERRRQFEERLYHSQKLESLGLLAGGVAHDFNNMLSVIQTSAGLARGMTPAGSPALELLDRVQEAVRRSRDLTAQMLAYAGTGKRLAQPCRLDQIAEEMLRLLKAAIPRRVTLDLELQHAPVRADVAQIRQIIMNLVTNAADAIAGHGDIRVRTGLRVLDEEVPTPAVAPEPLPPGDYAFVSVQDTGCGMPPDVLERIFDPFFSTKAQGRGLGLSALLGIVRAHGGGVSVTSSPGRGTRFEVLLPLHDA